MIRACMNFCFRWFSSMKLLIPKIQVLNFSSPILDIIDDPFQSLVQPKNNNWGMRIGYLIKNKSLYPSPVSAQQAWICHLWFLIDWRFKCLEISAGVKQPLTSCLLAKTKIFALLSSSCPMSLCSSSLVILSRSRSVESTTKMMNWKIRISGIWV